MAHVINNISKNHVANFKRTFIYPNEGKFRFQVELDKNGQVYEIRRSEAVLIKDEEAKKKFLKVILKDRPKFLYDHIKGRPFILAAPWIDDYVESLIEAENEEQ